MTNARRTFRNISLGLVATIATIVVVMATGGNWDGTIRTSASPHGETGSRPSEVTNDDLLPPELTNGKILFESNSQGGRKLFTMNPNGSETTCVVCDEGYSGSLSPDGTKIAFSRNDGLIWIKNADGTGTATSTGIVGFGPDWSPDGTKLVFVRDVPGPFFDREIFIANLNGSNAVNISNNPGTSTSTANDLWPEWGPAVPGFPDGRIAYRSTRTGNSDIFVASASPPYTTTNVTINNPSFEDSPTWSPDGTKIAFDSSRDGNNGFNEIYVLTVATPSSWSRMTNDPHNDNDPTWSPDGTLIAYQSYGGDAAGYDIKTVPSAPSDPVTPPTYITHSLFPQEYEPNWGPATGPPPRPDNDDIQNARVVTGTSGSVTGTNVGATRQVGNFRPEFNRPVEPNHAGVHGGKSVWYKWTAPGNGKVNFRTSNSNVLNTLLAVYQQTASSFVPIDSNDDRSSTDTSSRVEFRVVQGSVFYIAVDGQGGASGPLTLRWTLTEQQAVPTITHRITRMTDTNNQDIVGVQLGRSGSLEIILRGENFTALSRAFVNGDTCQRDANDGCEPSSSVQSTFRNDSTRLEVSIPPIYFTRLGTLRINVRTGNILAANTAVLKIAEFNFVDVQPGQTANTQSGAPINLRPPNRYTLQSTNTSSEPLRFTVYQYAQDLYSFQAAYDTWLNNGAVGPAPVPPDPSLGGASVAVVATPAGVAAGLQGLNLQLQPNLASLIGNDGSTLLNGATIVAASPLIGNDGSTLVGNDGGTLIGNDGSTLIGNDGSTLSAVGAANLISDTSWFISEQGGALTGNRTTIDWDNGTIVAANSGNVISDSGAGIIRKTPADVNTLHSRTFPLRPDGTSLAPNAETTTHSSATDAMLRRTGLFTVRNSSGNNAQIQTGMDANGNATATADINLNNTTSFPRVSALGRATTFSIMLNTGLLQFSQPTYTVSEGQPFVRVTVSRTGDTSGSAAATYFVTSTAGPEFGLTAGTATEGRDYEQIFGRLDFAPGQTEKTVDISIINDSYGSPDEAAAETFNIILNNAQGAAVAGTGSARITINDNDSATTTGNAITDAQFFVRQHYLDFLNREPDTAGFNSRVNQITSCQNLPTPDERDRCTNERRSSVSADLFLMPEFQATGFLVYRFYSASFPASAERPRGFPRYLEFMGNTQQITRGVIANTTGWEAQLEANQKAFALNWVQRPEFLARYPLTLTPAEFVDRLYQTAGITPAADERAAAITDYNSTSASVARARIVRKVADNQALQQREYRPAFVLMAYFGYLRRSPDDAPDGNFNGYDFWLQMLNQGGNTFAVNDAFVNTPEYKLRFGPTAAVPVAVSGRVTTPNGLGLRNAVVSITDSQGVRRTTTTSSFGVYSFGSVRTGESYTLGVSSKRFRFATRILQIGGNLANVDFVGLE